MVPDIGLPRNPKRVKGSLTNFLCEQETTKHNKEKTGKRNKPKQDKSICAQNCGPLLDAVRGTHRKPSKLDGSLVGH